MSASPVRVTAYGFFGMGNIGNDASLLAFVRYMRANRPEATLSCLAAGPELVRRDHGIAAEQLMSYRAKPGSSGVLVAAAKIGGRVRDVLRTFRMMGDVDVLVVPGTGALSVRPTAPPWGLPFWLFLATVSCRLRGRRVALLSVGAEYAENPITRWLFRWTVRLSDHCSYRDATSALAVRKMGVRRKAAEVLPDLAFLLPTPAEGPPRSGHVVIGLMAYKGGPDNPHRGPAVIDTYAERVVDLVTRLLDRGKAVTFVVGDEGDRDLGRQITEKVRLARPEVPPPRVQLSAASTLDEIMQVMSEAEAVVASRFHNVVCALKMVRPTVSLGYASKHDDLMAEFGLGDFCQSMESLDVDLLLAQIERVVRVFPSLEVGVKETLRRFEAQLEDALGRIVDGQLGTMGSAAPLTHAEPTGREASKRSRPRGVSRTGGDRPRRR